MCAIVCRFVWNVTHFWDANLLAMSRIFWWVFVCNVMMCVQLTTSFCAILCKYIYVQRCTFFVQFYAQFLLCNFLYNLLLNAPIMITDLKSIVLSQYFQIIIIDHLSLKIAQHCTINCTTSHRILPKISQNCTTLHTIAQTAQNCKTFHKLCNTARICNK